MYQCTEFFTGIIRLSDKAYIPSDPLNTDYRAYQLWLAAGNTPLPAVTSTPPAANTTAPAAATS